MKKVITTIIGVKISIFLIIFLGFSLLPFSKAGYYFNFHYPFAAHITLQTAFSTWDAQHYLFLAQKGYHSGNESNRFFPLLPSLIKLISPIFGYFFSGLIVANILSAIGCLYFYLLVKEYTNKKDIAYRSCIALLVFPTSFYFSLIYSESVFLGIVMPLFYYLYKKKLSFAMLCAFLLPLTRPTGIFIVVPLSVFAIQSYWVKAQIKTRKFLFKNVSLSPMVLPIASLMGLGLYLLIMYHTTGNSMTGFASQNTVVGRWQIFALFHPQQFFHIIFPPSLAIHGFTNSLIDRIFFLFFVCMLPGIWKKTNLIFFSYALVMGFVPLFGSFMSYTRYMVLIFPLFIVLGKFFSEEKKKYLFFPWIYMNLLVQTLFLILHALNYWVA